MLKIGVVTYETGNIASVVKALKEIETDPILISAPDQFAKVDAVVLPGVGHFGRAMRNLTNSNCVSTLRSALLDGLPTLGICLGFQLLGEASEEDLSIGGLGLLPFRVSRIAQNSDSSFKVPQIGWNRINHQLGESKLLEGLTPEERVFYYANSYGIVVDNATSVYASYFHGESYFALVENRSIFGVQFHPEKSSKQGLHVLQNFAKVIR